MAKKHYIKVTDIDTGYPINRALINWWSNTNYSGIISNKGYQGSVNRIPDDGIPITGLNSTYANDLFGNNNGWWYYTNSASETISFSNTKTPFSITSNKFGILDNSFEFNNKLWSAFLRAFYVTSLDDSIKIAESFSATNKVFRISWFYKPNWNNNNSFEFYYDPWGYLRGYKYDNNSKTSFNMNTPILLLSGKESEFNTPGAHEWYLFTQYIYTDKTRKIIDGESRRFSSCYKLSDKSLYTPPNLTQYDLVCTAGTDLIQQLYWLRENPGVDSKSYLWNPVFEEINEHSLTDYELLDPNSYTGHPGHVWAQTDESGTAELDYYIGDSGTLTVTKNRGIRSSSNYELPQTQPGTPIIDNIGIEPLAENSGGGGENDDWDWDIHWDPQVSWIRYNSQLTAQVFDYGGILLPVAEGKWFTYTLSHKSHIDALYNQSISSPTYQGYNSESYPNPFQFVTVSGDVDIHTAQNYYELKITVEDAFTVLSERVFRYDDPFIYPINPFGAVSFENNNNESSDVCGYFSITFNVDWENLIENPEIEKSYHDKSGTADLYHINFPDSISATDFSIEFQSCSSNIPQYNVDLNGLFSFEDLNFVTTNNNITRCFFTLSLKNETYNDFLNEVFSNEYQSITFSNICFNLSIFNSVTNEWINATTIGVLWTFTLSAINYAGQLIDEGDGNTKDITVWPNDAKVLWSLNTSEHWSDASLTSKRASVSNKLFYDKNDPIRAKFGWFRNDNLNDPLMIYEIPWITEIDDQYEDNEPCFSIYNPNSYTNTDPEAGNVFSINVETGVVISGGLSENLLIYYSNGDPSENTIGDVVGIAAATKTSLDTVSSSVTSISSDITSISGWKTEISGFISEDQTNGNLLLNYDSSSAMILSAGIIQLISVKTGGDNDGKISLSAQKGIDFWSNNSHFKFFSPANQNMLFINGFTGKVGIGTSNPNYELTVTGSISAGDIIYASAFSGDGSYLTDLTWTNISNTAHTHPYLPLSGGTVDGETYFTTGLSATTLSGNASALTAGNSDLLENHPASYFATSDHAHNYLPLSGGTVTGSTTFNSAGGLKCNLFDSSSFQGETIFNLNDNGIIFQYAGGDPFEAWFDGGTVIADYFSGNGSALVALTADDTDRFNAKLPEEYSLTGHTHNYLSLSGGTLTGSTPFIVTSGNTVFNNSSGDYDFQVKGNTDANTLYVDGSEDKVGIGTSTPNHKLTVNGSISASDTVYSASISSLSATFIDELIIPVLASDPASPKTGQIWFISS